MATGEQNITQIGGWQEVVGASGLILLQNQGLYTLQYYIGSAVPTIQHGVDLRAANEHAPKIVTGEKLYATSLKADSLIAWSA